MTPNATKFFIALLRVKARWSWEEIAHHFIDTGMPKRAFLILADLKTGEPNN